MNGVPGRAADGAQWARRLAALSWLFALVSLLAIWVLWYPPSPDLAAQVYRIHLFTVNGFSLWDNSWYDGHYVPGYSLIFPPLATLLGLRTVGVLAVSLSTLFFWRIARERRCFNEVPATLLFALGAAGDLYIGRVTFALGVTFALASALAATRGRRGWCAACSLACAAASPVAAAFLVLLAAADLLSNRVRSRAVLLGGPALTMMLALLLIFHEGGYEPFGLSSLLPAVGACIALLLLVPRSERLVRYTTLLYLGLLLFAYFFRSPMGSNAVRFGVLFAPAVLAGYAGIVEIEWTLVRVRSPWWKLRSSVARLPRRLGRPQTVWVFLLPLVALVGWQVTGPLSQSVGASSDPASRESFYTPVIRYLDSRDLSGPMRIEVPFTSSHWDAAILGARFDLARGWERQLDTRYDSLFYGPHLSAAAYQGWLVDDGVRFVVLSDAATDFSSIQEARLISRGLPFLRLVFESAHWHVYEVRGERPLATGPGYLASMNGDGFSVSATHAGTFLIRIHYTPYWDVTSGSGAVSEATGGWTRLSASRAGVIAVDAEL